MKLSPLDKIFSRSIRLRDKGTCQKCGNYLGLTQGLHCSHYHKRRKQSTRYDEENCCALCFGCHQYFEENHEEYKLFMINRLGQERFDMLEGRARIIQKLDRNAVELYYQEKIKELLAVNSHLVTSPELN